MTDPDEARRVAMGIGDAAFKLRVLRYLLANAYQEWRDTVWKRELDGLYCCDDRECCCGAETVREMWSWHVRAHLERTEHD